MKKYGGALSSISPEGAKRGELGRLEFYIENDGDGDFVLTSRDFGNYGRERYWATVELERQDVEDFIRALQDLLSGNTESTHVPMSLSEDIPEEEEIENDDELSEEEEEFISPEALADEAEGAEEITA
jgi:hypothetical protein